MLTGLLSDTLSRTGAVVLVAVMIVAAAAVAILIILLRAKNKADQAGGTEATQEGETTVRLSPEPGEKPAGMPGVGAAFAIECEITYVHTDERIP